MLKKTYLINLSNINDLQNFVNNLNNMVIADVDAMIVIGGRHSSNTQKLFEICKKECENTYYIQTIKDLDLTRLKSTDNVGITAGASTPNNIIEEVQKNVRNEF